MNAEQREPILLKIIELLMQALKCDNSVELQRIKADLQKQLDALGVPNGSNVVPLRDVQ